MTTLKGCFLKIPASISNPWGRTSVSYNLSGLLLVDGEISTFSSISFQYFYHGKHGGSSCSSGPGFCLGSTYGPSYNASVKLTIGSKSWSNSASGSSNPGYANFSSLTGSAVQIIITGGSDINNRQAITNLSSIATVGVAAVIDLTTIGLESGSHTLSVRASDDGQTKNMSNLSNTISYTQE